MCAALKVCTKRKAEIVKEYADEDMDEELQQKMEDEYEEANDIMQSVMELSGIFVKLYKDSVENVIVNNIVPDYYALF